MLSEERIKLMTRMASFEANEGRKMIPVTGYFRSDYVGFQMLRTAVSVTFAFLLFVGVMLFCRFDEMLADFYRTDLQSMIRQYLGEYVFVLLVYVLFAYILYSFRYTRAKKNVRVYQKALKKLSSMYSQGDGRER